MKLPVSRGALGAMLWSIPAVIFINDSLFTLSIVKDNGMAPVMKNGDIVLVDRRHKTLGGPESKINSVVLLRNPEAMRGETQLRLIRRIAQHPFRRGGELILRKDNWGDTNARDSREFGAVPEAIVLGHVVAVVFPPWRATKIE